MEDDSEKNLALGKVQDIYFAPSHIIIDRGLLTKYALNHVNIKEFADGTDELAKALSEGNSNIGIGLTDGFVASISNGSNFRIVGTFEESNEMGCLNKI